MTTDSLLETSLVFCNRSPNIMSYPLTRNRSSKNQIVPPVSVKRRFTGPYKPCPRAKRFALMDKPELVPPTHGSQLENSIENQQIDECVDFAVESTKINDPDGKNESNIEIIDSDEEDVSDEDDVSDAENNLNVTVADNQSELNIDRNLLQDALPVNEVVEENYNAVNSIQPIPDVNVLPPVLPTSSKFSIVAEKLPTITECKKWKTYYLHGHKLRYFKIILINCSLIISKCKNDMNDEYSSTPNKQFPCTSRSTPTKQTLNSIKIITKNVSTPEFTEMYEDAVAQKLRTLRKRLDTPTIKSRSNNCGLKLTSPSSNSTASPNTSLISTGNSRTSPNVANRQQHISPPSSNEKQPVHPRTKLTFSSIENSTLILNNLKSYGLRKSRRTNYVDLIDSDTESSIVTVSTDVKIEDENRTDDESVLSADDDQNHKGISRFVGDDAIKTELKCEVKSEEPAYEGKSYYIESDEELLTDLIDAYHQVEKGRTKRSSNSNITTISRTMSSTSPMKPSLIRLSPLKSPGNKYKVTPIIRRNSIQSTSSSSISSDEEIESTCDSLLPEESILHLKRFFTVKVVKLREETVNNLIELCSKGADWHDDGLLQKAGMRRYDINRLGIVTRSSQKASYGLRRFVKKKKTYDLIPFEKPKTSSNSEKQLNSKALKALKHKLKLQERREQKQRDKESIRRALLRINGRLMNQNKFWAFLNQGSSSQKPIVL